MELEKNCPVCGKEKYKLTNKYCSYACRNIMINKNKDYKNQSEKISKSLKKRKKELDKNIITKIVKCNNYLRCNTEFEVKSNNKREFKEKYYCCIFCARAVSGLASKGSYKKWNDKFLKTPRIKKCPYCEKEHFLMRKYCSDECVRAYKRKHLDNYKKYYNNALFKFSLNSYNEEFDFTLIKNTDGIKLKIGEII